MDLASLLLVNVGKKTAGWLLKWWLGEKAGDWASAVTDTLLDTAGDAFQKRRVERLFVDIGEEIARNLLGSFETEQMHRKKTGSVPDINVEAVSQQIGLALQTASDGKVSAEFLVRKNLDAEKLTQALREVHPVSDNWGLTDTDQVFYDRVLSETARYLVTVAGSLPRFQQDTFAEVLIRLDNHKTYLWSRLASTQRIESKIDALMKDGDQTTARFELDYRQKVLEELDRVDLFGADVPEEAQRNQLTDTFVRLRVHQSTAGGREGGVMSCAGFFAELDLLPGRFLIFAAAGGGKTTLMRWAAMQAARESSMSERVFVGRSLSQPVYSDFSVGDMERQVPEGRKARGQTLWDDCIPFFIRLRHCDGGRLPEPDQIPGLLKEKDDALASPPKGWVESVLKDGRGLILIDGVDEVPKEQRNELLYDIRLWTKKYKGCPFVVTTRPEAVPTGWLKGAGFLEATLEPLEREDQKELVAKWHAAVSKEARSRGQPVTDVEAMQQKLLDRLNNSQDLFLLSRNPLLCAMICALHWKTRGNMPDSQKKIVDKLCETLLERDRLSNLNVEFPEEYASLSLSQRRSIVQKLAEYMLTQEVSSVELDVAIRQAVEVLKIIPGRDADAAEKDTPIVLDCLVERSGLLQRPGPERLDFLHNTFKEMLAGERLAIGERFPELAKKISDLRNEAWRRAGLFAAADDDEPRAFASKLLRALLPQTKAGRGWQSEQKKQELRTLRMFVVRCRDVAEFLDDVEDQVDVVIRDLLPPDSMEEAEALAGLGDLALPWLKPTKKMGADRAAVCVRMLRLIETAGAQEMIVRYSDWEADVVMQELVQAVDDPVSLPGIRRWLDVPAGRRPSSGILKSITSLSGLLGVSWAQKATRLNLYRTGVVDVSPLAGLTALQTLYLSNIGVADASPLARLTALNTLHLGGTRVADASPLAGLTALQRLDLGATRVSDAAPLAGLTDLQELDLHSTGVVDVAALAGLTALQTLYLSYTGVSDLAALAGLTALQTLSLSHTGVSDLAALAGLTALQTLSLSHTGVSDLAPLAGLTALQILDLSNTPVSGLAPLAGLTGLQELNLSGTPNLMHKAIGVFEKLRKQAGLSAVRIQR